MLAFLQAASCFAFRQMQGIIRFFSQNAIVNEGLTVLFRFQTHTVQVPGSIKGIISMTC